MYRRVEPVSGELAALRIALPLLAIGGGGHGGFGEKEAEQVGQDATEVKGLSVLGCGHRLPEACAASLNKAVVEFLDQ